MKNSNRDTARAPRPATTSMNDAQQETAGLLRGTGLGPRRSGHALIDGVLTMTDANLPLPFWNRAVLEAPMTETGTTLATLREFYDGGAGPFLLDSAWPTPDLRPHGFTLMGHPPLMLRAPDRPLPAPRPALRIDPRRHRPGRATWSTRSSTGTHADVPTVHDGAPVHAGRLRRRRLAPLRRLRRRPPGRRGVRPTPARSSSASRTSQPCPKHTGSRFGATITAATIATDLSKPAVLVASDLGRPVYGELGFAAIGARDAGSARVRPRSRRRARYAIAAGSPSVATSAASLRPPMNSESSPGDPLRTTGSPSVVTTRERRRESR